MKAALAVGQNRARAPAVRAQDSPTTALVAENGVARMPIVVSADASKETRQAADELAGFLGQATGAHFDVTTGDGSPQAGITGTDTLYFVVDIVGAA